MKINPNNIFGKRRLEFCPITWTKLQIPKSSNSKISQVNMWIYDNTKGRYYIEDGLILNKDNKIETVTEIGFENKKDSTYFLMACPLFSGHI